MDPSEFEYDVALSFVARDEALATQLADLFEGRLRVFLYSRRQEQLAGTDGEKTFYDVFAKQSRLVAVLYRDGWGQTPWTRIEENAIRSRAYDDGYDFVIFIPLDDNPSVPKWLPRQRLWVNLKRWGVDGAAAVIEARFQELGGEPTDETLEQRAARVERALTFAKTRDNYLKSDAGVRGANEAFAQLRDAIVWAVPLLQVNSPSLGVSEKHKDRVVVLLSNDPARGIGTSLQVVWMLRYANTLNDSSLNASIWNSHPPFPGIDFFERPQSIATIQLMPDLDPSGEPAWSTTHGGDFRLLSSAAAAEMLLNWWLERARKERVGH